MKDLYSNLFYKIKFSIEDRESESDLLWKVVLHIKEWMTRKHNTRTVLALSNKNNDWTNLKNGGVLQGNNIKIVSEAFFTDEPFKAAYWACKITEFQESKTGCAPRQWTTEIGFEPVSPNKADFSCIISYRDRPGFVGDYEEIPKANIPNLIKILWEDSTLLCRNGIDTPTGKPIELKKGDWAAFWNDLNNEQRTIPYIYVSPRNSFEESESPNLVDPNELAIAVGGNAKVCYGLNIDVTNDMNDVCPPDYVCYDGAVRVYYTNIDESNPRDPKRHRFLSSRYINQSGSDHIIDIIRRAIAQDADFSERFFRVEDCVEKRNSFLRKKRLEELKRKHSKERKDLESNANDALQLAFDAEEKQLEAETLADSYAKEKDRLESENYNLRTELESYRQMAKENADLKKTSNSRYNTKEYPKTCNDIVNYFDAVFCDRIAFSEDAIQSLKDCTIPCEKLWNILFSLSTVMYDLYINGSGDIYKEFKHRTNIDVARGEGSMTHKNNKNMRQYKTEYHNDTIDIEPHITFSDKGQSVHFGFSKNDKKVIVGHCGEHLDNYTTQKVH